PRRVAFRAGSPCAASEPGSVRGYLACGHGRAWSRAGVVRDSARRATLRGEPARPGGRRRGRQRSAAVASGQPP
ncbi:hypothetical protein, partial [Mycobacterium sp.]|uniref:hypothetical protein n=1 Tax=Mycobacterium sp. TaxID=1785 RepID=UPI0026105314